MARFALRLLTLLALLSGCLGMAAPCLAQAPYAPTGGAPSGPRVVAAPTSPLSNSDGQLTSFDNRFTPPPAAAPHVFEPAQLIATVGDQFIFRGDLIGDVNLMLAPSLERMSPEQIAAQQEQIDREREKLIERLLPGVIERKLLYVAFLQTIPADKRGEAVLQIQKRTTEMFDERLKSVRDEVNSADEEQLQSIVRENPITGRLAILMQEKQLATMADLDAELRRLGSSLRKQKTAFGERMLGQSAVGRSIDVSPEVTHEEMVQYYQQHLEDYDIPAKARWEQLTARFDRFPDKASAWAALGAWGNEVLGGASFASVAKRQSHGPTAQEGGQYDWTTKGSLVSQVLDDAIFSLPVGELSQRLEDEQGFHIIRVVQRRQASRVPFLEAQVEIKKQLQRERRSEQIGEFVQELRTMIPVWTIYDEQP